MIVNDGGWFTIKKFIDNGKIFKVGSTGRVRPVQTLEYGGLFNRSKNSGNLKIAFSGGESGFSGTVRGNYRGRFGFGDKNNNSILDDESEYVPGYTLWNFTVSQKISRLLNAQGGIDNLFDETNPSLIPALAGRMLFVSLSLQYF